MSRLPVLFDGSNQVVYLLTAWVGGEVKVAEVAEIK